jgi:hypothetical protein
MEATTSLFKSLVGAGYNGRNSSSFVGKVVTLCLIGGLAENEANCVLGVLESSCLLGRMAGTNTLSILESCPPLAQVIAEAYNCTVGQLRGKEVGFEVVLHAVIDYRIKH